MRKYLSAWILTVTLVTVYSGSTNNELGDRSRSRESASIRGKKGRSEQKEIVTVLRDDEGIYRKGESLNSLKTPILWKKSNIGQYKRDTRLFTLEENIPARTYRKLPYNPEAEAHSRSKRTTVQLDADEMALLLDLQNYFRSGEGASNMEYNTWSGVLAEMAQDWANGCRWGHGFPDYGERRPYEYLGQNIFAWSGNVLNFTHASFAWFNEKYIYDFDTGACSGDCGHYTQIVWASTKELGCGLATCPGMVGGTGDQYLVCNYGPAGNWGGEQPFKKGYACSKCESGSSWCTNNMCNTEGCESGSSNNCVCLAACHNCATYNEETCSCSCADGWANTDCSEVCEDHHENCGANPGWPYAWCFGGGFSENIYRACWALCDRCVKAEPVLGECPVVGPGPSSATTLHLYLARMMSQLTIFIHFLLFIIHQMMTS